MEILLVLLAVLLVCGVGAAVLTKIPFSSFRFEHQGRRFVVRSFVFYETIEVDGQAVADTRVGGDRLSAGLHAITLPDGRQLDIAVTSDGVNATRCRATVGGQMVFDSFDVLPQATRPAVARLPDPPAAAPIATEAVPADPRWAAASVLLGELGGSPDVRDAAGLLGQELRAAMVRLDQARAAADAHTALGGGSAADALIASREEAVVDLLAVLRELHLATADRGEVTPVPGAARVARSGAARAQETLRRLEAEREVESARLRRVAADARARTTRTSG